MNQWEADSKWRTFLVLTHFRPLFLLRRSQAVGFYKQMFEKHLRNSDILSKDAGRWLTSLLKMLLFHRYFSNILLVKTNYLVYPLSGTLIKNGLIMLMSHWTSLKFFVKWVNYSLEGTWRHDWCDKSYTSKYHCIAPNWKTSLQISLIWS